MATCDIQLLTLLTVIFVARLTETFDIIGESTIVHNASKSPISFIAPPISHMTGDYRLVDDVRRLPDDGITNDECHKVVEHLGQTLSEYSQCISIYSLQSGVCIQCVQEYLAVCKLLKTNFSLITDEYGQMCSERQIVTEGSWMLEAAFTFISTWQELHCDNCYVQPNETCTLTPLNDDIVSFLKMSNVFYQCASNATHGEFHEPFVLSNRTLNTTACTDCAQVYKNLGNIYISIEKHYKDHMCQDVSDVMNYTRWLWSEMFHCHIPYADISILMIVSCFLALIPITFYVGTYVNGDEITKKLLPQRRLRSTASSTQINSDS